MYYLYEMVLGGWVHKCFAKKNIFGGDNIQHIAPKVKKKYVITLKIFVVFILEFDEIVY